MSIAMPAATRDQTAVLAGLVVAVVGAGAILFAYYFQYVLNYLPCPLCYQQRIAYYIAIPLGLVVAGGARLGAPRWLLIGGLAVIALAFLGNAGLGAFHAGVEWKWWEGP